MKLKVCPPVVTNTGLMPRVAIEGHAKLGMAPWLSGIIWQAPGVVKA